MRAFHHGADERLLFPEVTGQWTHRLGDTFRSKVAGELRQPELTRRAVGKLQNVDATHLAVSLHE